jgi:arginine N-succinyltransferase
MLVIRPVRTDDVSDLLVLAKKAGQGLTSLPADEQALEAKTRRSVESFERDEPHPDDYFLLVMEDTNKRKVVGTAAVYGQTGTRQAFYAYRIMSVTHHSHSLDKQVRSEVLHLSNDYTDCAEVGTLFLDPDYRGNGHWLSRSRYLLMAKFPKRFQPNVIAEMRGWVDDQGISPFWEAIGRQFFEMSFAEADHLCGIGSNLFITELMPKYPIYTCLLPKEARDVIGKPHDETIRAVELLEDEGFEYEKMVDIFDGGPLLRAKIKHLKSVRNLQLRLARTASDSDLPKKALVAYGDMNNFRVRFTSVDVDDHRILLSADDLTLLQAAENAEVSLLLQEPKS